MMAATGGRIIPDPPREHYTTAMTNASPNKGFVIRGVDANVENLIKYGINRPAPIGGVNCFTTVQPAPGGGVVDSDPGR